MKCLMAENQRRAILDATGNGTLLEWGLGGTTRWLLDNGIGRVVSVEHDGRWYDKAIFEIGKRGNWSPRHMHAEAGVNATPAEEDPTGAASYIAAGQYNTPDVYLIDGIARGACLVGLLARSRPCVAFLHDTQRDWYDWAIGTVEFAGATCTPIPATPGDYPSHMTRIDMP